MSLVIDFFENKKVDGGGVTTDPRYIARLRVKDDQIVDLVSKNSWTNNGVTIGESIIINGGNSLKFENRAYLESILDPLNDESTLDFTISLFTNITDVYRSIPDNYCAWISQWGGSDKLKAGSYGFALTSTNTLGCSFYSTPVDYDDLPSGTNVPFNQINHVAFTRQDNLVKLFLNGKIVLSATRDLRLNAETSTRIGTDLEHAGGISGLMDDICIIKGKALWTEDFTPPTTYLPDDLDTII